MATERPAPTPRPVLVALLTLTFTTGLVDAVSILGLGNVFTANMTGNVVLLGFAIGGASQFSVAASLLSLGAFALGALVGSRMGRRVPGPLHRWLVAALVLEIVLVAIAAAVAIGLDAPAEGARRFVIIALLASAMGARNAAVRGLAIKDLTTTVLTMTLTGLAADSRLAGGEGQGAGRRLGAVVAMLAGAVAGALLVINVDLFTPLVVVTLLAGVALFLIVRMERRTPPASRAARAR